MRMRVLSGNTLRSAATVPGRDHFPEAPVPSTEYAVAVKYRMVGRRRVLDEGWSAEPIVRSAKVIRATRNIRRIAHLPKVRSTATGIMKQIRYRANDTALKSAARPSLKALRSRTVRVLGPQSRAPSQDARSVWHS